MPSAEVTEAGRTRLIWGLALTLFAIFVGVAIYASRIPPPSTNGCDPTKPVTEALALVIDRTDPLTPNQVRAVTGLRDEALVAAPRNTLVGLFGIQDRNEGVLSQGFCRCRQKRGAEAQVATESPLLTQRDFDRQFLEPLSAELKSTLLVQESPNSPILEAIRELGALGDFSPRRVHLRVILVSDMIQNSPLASFYDSAPDARLLKEAGVNELIPFLKNAEVRVMQLERPSIAHLQTPQLETFWTSYFLNCGADMSRFTYEHVPAASLPTTPRASVRGAP